MKSEEIKKELGLGYQELVDYLLDKYGPAEGDYFRNETCKSKNPIVSRSSEGLECHHIDEDKAIMLSDSRWASKNPFEYQKADRLVYCNVLEHLILHAKIIEEPRNKKANKLESPGVGGVINYLCPKINDYYNGYEFKRDYQRKMFSLIADNFDDYIEILRYILVIIYKRPEYSLLITKERLARGTDHCIIEKIYKLI